ncbi:MULTISPECIES: glutathione S-transferase family protein [Ramlibacter]|uniref:Glutathione S-transferase family protein n=1 Tax=Ramlibacter pinisoli TaxID=2682844 RepID=A0A6N8IVB0_9BURK|nr:MULTISPECIES: glutathione S-transferase family protein [Ramlibacter]MBA2960790.1 glutathione S-transferase family protein [Ramlibacter sp. CGMCC 1.13660]MVQ30738.1 glutathione S-transferase family protein [Ramlibacter pinisoli]
MTDLILHHYPESPFSEKVRLMLGAKKLAWKSVHVPRIQPKPDVVALTGGYRRTPFLQVGADIYCDTALIADVLEHVQPDPALYPLPLKGVTRIFAQWADSTLFWAAMAYSIQPKSAAAMFPDEATAQAFLVDRKAMRTNMTQLRAADATSAYRSYLRRVAHMADEHDFLFGAEPCIADFAAYHPLWYTRRRAPVMAGILQATPSLLEWMDRIEAIGHGVSDTLSAEDAIQVAAQAQPLAAGQNLLVDSAFQDDHGIPLGSRVAITAESFGAEPTEGELVAATRTHYSLARTDDRAGAVHVHFPRIGYVLRKADGT